MRDPRDPSKVVARAKLVEEGIVVLKTSAQIEAEREEAEAKARALSAAARDRRIARQRILDAEIGRVRKEREVREAKAKA